MSAESDTGSAGGTRSTGFGSRWAIGGLGVLLGLYGVWLLLSREGSTAGLIAAVIWLAAGVVLHDAVLAPLTIALMWVGRRVLPSHAHAASVVALVVLGSATVFAIPVLGRFGARSDNSTLLPRSYDLGWVVLVALVLVGITVGELLRRRRSTST